MKGSSLPVMAYNEVISKSYLLSYFPYRHVCCQNKYVACQEVVSKLTEVHKPQGPISFYESGIY